METERTFETRYNGHTVRVVWWYEYESDATVADMFPGVKLSDLDYETFQEARNALQVDPDLRKAYLDTFNATNWEIVDVVTFNDGTTLDSDGWLNGETGGYQVDRTYPAAIHNTDRDYYGIDTEEGYGPADDYAHDVGAMLDGTADIRTIGYRIDVDGEEVADESLGYVWEPRFGDWQALDAASVDIGQYVADPPSDPAVGWPVVLVGNLDGMGRA